MKTHPKIRFANQEDMDQIIDLCELHAIYEKSEYSKIGKVAQLHKDLFSHSPKLFCLVVEDDKKLIAYATFMKQYATWDAREYIYMDCLYVKDEFRSRGIGEQLVDRIKEEGKKLNCDIMQWQTPDFNKRAMKFYRRIGAYGKSKERFFLSIESS